jgi:hypothetical protein
MEKGFVDAVKLILTAVVALVAVLPKCASEAPNAPAGQGVVIVNEPDREHPEGRRRLTVKWPDGQESVAYAAKGKCAEGLQYPKCTEE